MNSNSQLDLHPDAESLNAFVEKALAERERGQILAHLAECSRCRQVVYLAQEASAEMEPVVAVSALHSPAGLELWLRNWWFAWAPVGALAVVFAVGYVVHVRRVEMASEMAKVTIPATRNDAGASTPGKPPTGIQASPPFTTAAPTRPVSNGAKQEQPNLASKRLTLSAAGPSAGEASEMSSASRGEAAQPPSAPGAGYPAMGAIAEYKPERAMAATQEEQQRAATTYQVQSEAAEKQSLANTNGLAKREPVGGTLTAAAPMAQIDARAPRSGTFDSGGRLKSSGAFAAYRVNSPTLPSGLPALSTATTRSYALAVDRAGAVFLSEDSGSHWESITKQWTGRAVTIRVEPVVSARESATVSPAAVFEITNDQGQVWVSTGGRIWKAK